MYRKAGAKEVYQVCSHNRMIFLITMVVVVDCLLFLRMFTLLSIPEVGSGGSYRQENVKA